MAFAQEDFEDTYYNTKLRIEKLDAETGDNIIHDGALFNLRFDPKGIQGEKGLDIIEGVIRTYFEEGGEHIQINVVDDKTLRAAQQTPEK